MDERLRIVLEAQSKADAAFRNFTTHLQRTTKHVRDVQAAAAQMSSNSRASFTAFGTSARSAGTAAGTASRVISSAMHGVSAAVSSAVTSIRHLPSALAAAAAAAGRAAGPLRSFAGMAGRMLPGAGMIGGAAGLLGGLGVGLAGKEFGERGVGMNLTREGGMTALTSLLGGDQAKAKKFFAELEKEAAKSIPTLKDLIPIATQLVQAYGPSGLGKVIPTIRAFGDAASITAGGDTNRMNMALLGLRQLITSANLSQEEINQVGENLGVSTSNILKQTFGTADPDALRAAGRTGAQVADAIVAGLVAKFGGAQAAMAKKIPGLASNIDDALNALAGRSTEGLTKSIGKALESVLGALNKALERGNLAKSMGVVFGVFGKMAEALAGNLEKVFKWIEQIANAKGLQLFIINVIALAQTLGDRLLSLFGVDLKKAMDPKNVTAWFEAFGQAVANVIDTAFGMGRVFQEVVTKMIPGFFVDLGSRIGDFATDTVRVFQVMFARMERTIAEFQEAIIGAFLSMANALNKVDIFGFKPFKFDTAEMEVSLENAKSRQTRAQGRLMELGGEEMTEQARRRERERKRDVEDPFRRQDPFGRIRDAFTGKGRDVSAQTQFWKDFEAKRQDAAKWLFKGANGPAGGGSPGFPGAPQMFGGGGGGRGQVIIPPQMQAFPGAGGGGGGFGESPFAPVKLPDGRTVPAWMAQGQGTIAAGAGMVGRAAAGAAGGLNVNVNVASPPLGMMLRDPLFAAALQEFINAWVESKQQLAFPGPAMP